MMAWVFLCGAICAEVIATSAMKLSNGMSQAVPATISMLFYTCAGISAAMAMKDLELSLVYPIWCGLGLALTTVIGIYLFGETINWRKLLCIGLILIGVVGLHLSQDNPK